jgi:hypothetical protein
MSLKMHSVGFQFRIFVISKQAVRTLLSGFRRDADEICALLGYYAL